jgi:hypothetical protein
VNQRFETSNRWPDLPGQYRSQQGPKLQQQQQHPQQGRQTRHQGPNQGSPQVGQRQNMFNWMRKNNVNTNTTNQTQNQSQNGLFSTEDLFHKMEEISMISVSCNTRSEKFMQVFKLAMKYNVAFNGSP